MLLLFPLSLLQSYLRFVIVSKPDFKFEQNPIMDSGDIGRAH